ncbi:hypothetical protein Pelo_17738 [Pelomyxa schiedti]|nr:hypothetical protein Pelo_17738 [Pelomyxa schiedti]
MELSQGWRNAFNQFILGEFFAPMAKPNEFHNVGMVWKWYCVSRWFFIFKTWPVCPGDCGASHFLISETQCIWVEAVRVANLCLGSFTALVHGNVLRVTTMYSHHCLQYPEVILWQQTQIEIKEDPATFGNQYPQYDKTKTDVWSFGILVHAVVAPLSLVYLKSTSGLSISTGRLQWQHQEEAVSATSPSVASLPHWPKDKPPPSSPNYTPSPTDGSTVGKKSKKNTHRGSSHSKQVAPTRQVERGLVGNALASGTLVVGFQEGTGMMMLTPAMGDNPNQHQQQQQVEEPFPRWAQQLVTLCLVAEPTNRPTIQQLLVVWNYY